ncbi:MAG: nucleotidyltransferase domain-containing protein [Prevotella sp.]|nr:nucleotidyltransferase domain-containing protein [Prevotella sp.]
MKFGLSDTTIQELHNVFRRYANIEKVLIFGSRSKGNYRAGSDIDLAIIGKDIDYPLLLDVQCDIEDLDFLYSIDLLDYQKKKGTPIGDHIDRVGQVFYEAA